MEHTPKITVFSERFNNFALSSRRTSREKAEENGAQNYYWTFNVHEEGWDGKETQKLLIDQKCARINTHTHAHTHCLSPFGFLFDLTKCPRLSDLQTAKVCFSQFHRLKSARSQPWQIQCLLRTYFLTDNDRLLTTSRSRKDEGAVSGLFY